jgi:hypothetical protein
LNVKGQEALPGNLFKDHCNGSLATYNLLSRNNGRYHIPTQLVLLYSEPKAKRAIYSPPAHQYPKGYFLLYWFLQSSIPSWNKWTQEIGKDNSIQPKHNSRWYVKN